MMGLIEFKEFFGHCRVPQNWGKLGRWVKTQRHLRNKGAIPMERFELLNSLGFEWEGEMRKKYLIMNATFEDTLRKIKQQLVTDGLFPQWKN